MSGNKKLCKWLFQTKMTYNVHEEKKNSFRWFIISFANSLMWLFLLCSRDNSQVRIWLEAKSKKHFPIILLKLNQCTELQDVRYKLPIIIIYHHLEIQWEQLLNKIHLTNRYSTTNRNETSPTYLHRYQHQINKLVNLPLFKVE